MTDEKTLAALEYHEILTMLENCAPNYVTRAAAKNLRPSSDFSEACKLCKQTNEAVDFLLKRSFVVTTDLSDITSCVSRAKKGGMLSVGEILACGALLSIARSMRAFFANINEKESSLLEFVNVITANKELEKAINDAIIPPDSLSDNASPALYSIRRAIRNAHAKIKRDLDEFLRRSSIQKHLQDDIVTIRNERYVVPVKAESKSFIKGILQGSSGTRSTVFIEPDFIVEANNEIRNLQSSESDEIERILRKLSAEISDNSDMLLTDFHAVSRLDFIFTKAQFALSINAALPHLNLFGKIKIDKGRHPLINPTNVVPIDLEMGDDLRTLVVTGPNTGGKTVALKTVGLFCVMAASGLLIPAQQSSEIPIFERVFADIGDEQSIQQNLSTFSSHMTNIVSILSDLPPNSLVLFDELGAGTDPDEGAALAVSILEYTKNAGAITIATTHYSQLKLYAITENGVQNAGCEFDINTLQPTYRLLVGIPGKSNAFAISERLGLSARIIEQARTSLTTHNSKFEDAIRNLHEKAEAFEEMSSTQREDFHKSAILKTELEGELQRQKNEQNKIISNAKLKAKKIIDDTRREAEEIIKQLKNAHQSDANAKIIEARTRLNKSSEYTQPLIEIPKESLKPNRVTFDGGKAKATSSVKISKKGGSSEIDLRGYRLDDAIIESENFIDQAITSGLNSLTIIHGKGTGALRNGLHKMLKKNPLVKSFRLGKFGEGEAGVTIVELN
ncbi:MAG: endonuclease MutS2 [Clostridiales bacterium]|jgi:DNA mismatch repair protein MutS2|nr:endonuclease MutS2 [Clostridiales bacterium]